MFSYGFALLIGVIISPKIKNIELIYMALECFRELSPSFEYRQTDWERFLLFALGTATKRSEMIRYLLLYIYVFKHVKNWKSYALLTHLFEAPRTLEQEET